MNVTVNQIRQEMTTLVQAHEMVNSFFWGDFHRAYNEKDQFYPLVCSYLSDGAINTNLTQMQLVVIVCDKTFKGFENLNDTESDTLTVARHLYNVIRQSPRWNALLRVNSSTFTKFYENTSDEVAGVILTMNVDLKQSRSLCDLPLDNYDFDGQFVGNDCEPVLIVNSNQSFSFNAPSGTIVELPDTPVLVTDQDGNELGGGNLPSVTGGTIQVQAGGVCLDATYQLTLDGEPLAGGGGSIPSGENANIPIDEFIPPCDPATVQINGEEVATVASGGMVNIAVENESGTPLGAFDEETGVWVVPDCPPCDPVEISVNGDLEVTAAAGTSSNITTIDQNSAPVVPMAVNVSGNDIEIQVNVPEPSGIAYFEPNDMAYPLPSFADYDDGWRVNQGIFRNVKPAYPLYVQSLNPLAPIPDISLTHPNKYGTLNPDGTHARYTRIGGSTTPWDGVEPIFDIEDHLMGRTLRRLSNSGIFRTWEVSLDLLVADGFYKPSQQEWFAMKNQNSTDITIMGILISLAGHNEWTGTTDRANTANAMRLVNTYPTASTVKTNMLRGGLYIKRIED
jgi:hypothetical protein